MKKNSQMSSSLAVGILLALAGGFMDAYSYMARGHVFANAQTGNILLFAVAISEGRPADSLRYLLPVVSFALGIALAAAMRTRFGHMSRLHWRQHPPGRNSDPLRGQLFPGGTASWGQ